MSSLGLSELVLIVEDVPASTRFYEEVVGLKLENEPSDDWAWFWAGQEGKGSASPFIAARSSSKGNHPTPKASDSDRFTSRSRSRLTTSTKPLRAFVSPA